MRFTRRCMVVAALVATVGVPTNAASEESGTLHFRVTDEQGQWMPCRIHLRDDQGQTQRAAGLPFWRDHFVCGGEATVTVRPGQYSYELERGPEVARGRGRVFVMPDQPTEVRVSLPRLTTLRDQGWFSGDLHVHREPDDIPLLMRAEDLDFAPVITWWNSRNHWQDRTPPATWVRTVDGHRLFTLMAGEDEREGGALLYFGLGRPLDLTAESREVPSPMQFVREAYQRNPAIWIDIEKPFWWDVPTWLASGQMHSIGLANNHMCRSEMYEHEAWGKPRDAARLPPPRGNGLWTQELYYQMLECGLRLPPSAGSASGVLPNPVGYNRVYVHLGEDLFTRDNWFAALRRGACFVTNGPLLIAQVNGRQPGHEFQLSGDDPLKVQLRIELTTQDPIEDVEVIYNNRVLRKLPWAGKLQETMECELELGEPGWLLVRAITTESHTFRFASTAPWYVRGADDALRVSRASATFFLKWVQQRIERIQAEVPPSEARDAVLAPHLTARRYWTALRNEANQDEGNECE